MQRYRFVAAKRSAREPPAHVSKLGLLAADDTGGAGRARVSPELAASRSLTCMTTSTDWPRGGPAKDREASGNKGVLKRRNRLLTDPFQRVLAGRQSGLHRIPKPRAAGSIPAEGTPSTFTNALPGPTEEGVVGTSFAPARQVVFGWGLEGQHAAESSTQALRGGDIRVS
jgi:hypothetical protein